MLPYGNCENPIGIGFFFLPEVGQRNINRFPFRNMKSPQTVVCKALHMGFPYILGPAYPQPNTVPVEPFSTSVFKLGF